MSTIKADTIESVTTNGPITLSPNGTGDVVVELDSSATPLNNGDLVIEATANTTLTFKLKGTDGTVRSGTITLS